jgi:hypothetical protein
VVVNPVITTKRKDCDSGKWHLIHARAGTKPRHGLAVLVEVHILGQLGWGAKAVAIYFALSSLITLLGLVSSTKVHVGSSQGVRMDDQTALACAFWAGAFCFIVAQPQVTYNKSWPAAGRQLERVSGSSAVTFGDAHDD